MTPEDRTTVLIEGDLPEALEFANRHLGLASLKEVADVQTPGARAALLQFGSLSSDAERQRGVKWLRKYAVPAASAGCLIVVTAADDDIAAAGAITRSGAGTLAQFGAGFGGAPQIIVRPKSELPAVAEAIARHSCGSSAEPGLKILDYDTGDDVKLDDEIDALMRRAFFDFSSLRVKREDGGRSRIDGVWSVHPVRKDGAAVTAFAVKCGPTADVDVAIATQTQFVDLLPFHGCAPLCPDRCVRGATRRLAVSRFLESAERLDKAVLHRSVSTAITAVYADVLGRMRQNPQPATSNAFEAFLPADDWVIRKYGTELERTHQRLKRRGVATLDSTELHRFFYEASREPRPEVWSHADLNIRNVFVYERSGAPALIDFSARKRLPLSHDFARLDVGLSFDEALSSTLNRLPEPVLFGLYGEDLFAPSLEAKRIALSVSPHQFEAIEAIRLRALSEASSARFDIVREYVLAVCASLLYYARNEDEMSDIAYRCVSRQVDGLR